MNEKLVLYFCYNLLILISKSNYNGKYCLTSLPMNKPVHDLLPLYYHWITYLLKRKKERKERKEEVEGKEIKRSSKMSNILLRNKNSLISK